VKRRQSKTRSPAAVVGYVRLSPRGEEKDDPKLGIDAQRAAIETWATSQGACVTSWHVDDRVSGDAAPDERPALLRAMDALEAENAGFLAVARRDRLARDVLVAAMIERAVRKVGARVVSAAGEANGDTPADDFMRTVLDGASAYERAMIKARTRAALKVKRDKGEVVGGVPYGFKRSEDGKHLVPEESEQQVIRCVRRLNDQNKSLRTIASELQASGYVSRAGKPFSHAQVGRMLRDRDEAGRPL
jgi:site-specific DNA recombinase